ncbi:hypothetical protein J4E81_007218 [Alternaria sp. BMP 2799]|nr:hypothetical protein J4E81_007218 [Alternaria sp. BMP 2799]
MKFPSILTQLKVLVTTAATLACSIPHLYEKIVAKLSSTETAATPKYMYVGHARVFFAQGGKSREYENCDRDEEG